MMFPALGTTRTTEVVTSESCGKLDCRKAACMRGRGQHKGVKPPARGLAARRHVGEAMTCAIHPEYRSGTFGFAV